MSRGGRRVQRKRAVALESRTWSLVCPRCDGTTWWKNWCNGRTYRSCLTCGFEPARVHTDARYAADLQAEAEQHNSGPRLGGHNGGGPVQLSAADERSLRRLEEERQHG